jgi:antitoxin VapB
LFQNGNSQAVRLPKEYRFKSDRVYLKKMGNAVILLPYGAPWQSLVDSLSLFSSDFMQERAQPPAEQRENAYL